MEQEFKNVTKEVVVKNIRSSFLESFKIFSKNIPIILPYMVLLSFFYSLGDLFVSVTFGFYFNIILAVVFFNLSVLLFFHLISCEKRFLKNKKNYNFYINLYKNILGTELRSLIGSLRTNLFMLALPVFLVIDIIVLFVLGDGSLLDFDAFLFEVPNIFFMVLYMPMVVYMTTFFYKNSIGFSFLNSSFLAFSFFKIDNAEKFNFLISEKVNYSLFHFVKEKGNKIILLSVYVTLALLFLASLVGFIAGGGFAYFFPNNADNNILNFIYVISAGLFSGYVFTLFFLVFYKNCLHCFDIESGVKETESETTWDKNKSYST